LTAKSQTYLADIGRLGLSLVFTGSIPKSQHLKKVRWVCHFSSALPFFVGIFSFDSGLGFLIKVIFGD
jgi:hypothetical protein